MTPPTKKQWLRFSLRTVLVFVAMLGVFFALTREQPISPTDASRTKAAFGIWEWAFTPGYKGGFSVCVFDGVEEREALTVLPGETVRSIYLQRSPESGDFVVKIDAGDGGYYGGEISDPFSGCLPGFHRSPKSHKNLWVLVNHQDGIAESHGLNSAFIAISFFGTGGFAASEAFPISRPSGTPRH